MSRRRAPQRGFTLIELMVAITLALILTGGVIAMFLAGKQAYRTAEAQARVQEDARFAMEYMARYLRMAGYRADPFWGGPLQNPLIICQNNADGTNTCDGVASATAPDAFLAVRYQVFPGDVACDGSIPVASTAKDPGETAAVFSVRVDPNTGGKTLYCNGSPLVAGVQEVEPGFVTVDAQGNTAVRDAGQMLSLGNMDGVGAIRLKVTVNTRDGAVVNPGIAGGDDLTRELTTTVHLRNLCETCEAIHAKSIEDAGSGDDDPSGGDPGAEES